MRKIIFIFLLVLITFPLVANDKVTQAPKSALSETVKPIDKNQDNNLEILLLRERNKLLDDHNKQLMTVLWYALGLIAAFLGAGFLFYRSQVQSERKELKLMINKDVSDLKEKIESDYKKYTDMLLSSFDNKIEEADNILILELDKRLDTITKEQANTKKIAESIRWDARRELKSSEAHLYNYFIKDYLSALKAYLWVLRYDIKLEKHNSIDYLDEELIRSTLISINDLLEEKVKLEDIDGSTLTDLQNTVMELPSNYDLLKNKVIKKLG